MKHSDRSGRLVIVSDSGVCLGDVEALGTIFARQSFVS